jgi:hypothetical protein
MLMNNSITPGALVEQMTQAARARFPSDAAWAAACGLPRETLSRLKRNPSCDLRTLAALANVAGCALVAVPAGVPTSADEGHLPASWTREREELLLDLCASGNLDHAAWRASGPAYFMGGLAVLLAGARGFTREPYLRLAEELHPGISVPAVFQGWLDRSPLRAARFLPMARHRKGVA